MNEGLFRVRFWKDRRILKYACPSIHPELCGKLDGSVQTMRCSGTGYQMHVLSCNVPQLVINPNYHEITIYLQGGYDEDRYYEDYVVFPPDEEMPECLMDRLIHGLYSYDYIQAQVVLAQQGLG